MDETTPDDAGEIFVSNRQSFLPIDEASVAALVGAILGAEGRAGAGEVNVTFVDKVEMTRLNSQYRGIAEPTDVLSFAAAESAGDEEFVSPVAVLGDIVVCPEVAAANALGQGHSPGREVMEMVVHGMLHLLGHDHATAPAERAMLARQTELADGLIGKRGRA